MHQANRLERRNGSTVSADTRSEEPSATESISSSEGTSTTANGVPLHERLALSIEEAGALLGISRDLAYDLVARRELPSGSARSAVGGTSSSAGRSTLTSDRGTVTACLNRYSSEANAHRFGSC